MNLAVIPARGGSKRIPRKNILEFCGKPIIAWTIEAAFASGCFDKIVVSTDDAEIAEVARQFGAAVPFIRPSSLSGDMVGTTAVVAHSVNWHAAAHGVPAAVCCLYATAPMLQPDDVKRGLELLSYHECSYAFAVTKYPFPIQRAIRIGEAGRIEMIEPLQFESRSQDLDETYHDAGQFYWGLPEAWLGNVPIFSPASVPVVLPRHRVVDIDTPEDWARAEIAFRLNREMARSNAFARVS